MLTGGSFLGMLSIQVGKDRYERSGLTGKPIRSGGRKHVKERFGSSLFPLDFLYVYLYEHALILRQPLRSISANHPCCMAKRVLSESSGHANTFLMLRSPGFSPAMPRIRILWTKVRGKQHLFHGCVLTGFSCCYASEVSS